MNNVGAKVRHPNPGCDALGAQGEQFEFCQRLQGQAGLTNGLGTLPGNREEVFRGGFLLADFEEVQADGVMDSGDVVGRRI